jgi:hypothetical protein
MEFLIFLRARLKEYSVLVLRENFTTSLSLSSLSVLYVQKPYSLFHLFLSGDCIEHGKRQEEANDQKGKRREKKKAQGKTSEEVVSIAVYHPFSKSS